MKISYEYKTTIIFYDSKKPDQFHCPQAIWKTQTQLKPVAITRFDILKYIWTNLLLEVHLTGWKIYSDMTIALFNEGLLLLCLKPKKYKTRIATKWQYIHIKSKSWVLVWKCLIKRLYDFLTWNMLALPAKSFFSLKTKD